MNTLFGVWRWLTSKVREGQVGQTSIEYVLVILAVVLFLVVAAGAMTGVLGNAVASISTWIAAINPAVP